MLKNKIKLIILLLCSISLYSQDVIVIGNSDYNNIEYISSSLLEINIEHRNWNGYNEELIIDSLLLINNSIILWQIDTLLTNNVILTIDQKINDNNSFLLFSNNIENNDLLNNLFGFIKIRNNFSESISDIDFNYNWSLNLDNSISELSWIGTATPSHKYVDSNAFASIKNTFSNGRTFFAGFDLDNLENLSNFLEVLLSDYFSYYNQIIIESVNGIPGDTLFIPIKSNFVDDIIAISFSIQSDPEFLYFFDMISHPELDNFVWDINPLPFGIIEINGVAMDGVLDLGESELGYLKALLYPSSVNKVSLRGMNNLITYNSGESAGALFKNGEVDVLFDYSVVELIPPSLIEPDSLGIMDIDLSTDNQITAIQLCLEYESNIIGINNITPTTNIPDSWFVTFVNHPASNRSEIFCFGFEPMNQVSGTIIEVELESYSQNPSIASIDFCYILLAGEDSDNINSFGIDTEILIDFPDLIISPSGVIVDENIDVLFNILNNQQISGFQYDITFNSGLNLINILQGNLSNDFIGNWALLDDRRIRCIYFNESYNTDFSSLGYLLSSGYTFINNDIEEFSFEVNNVIVTDQNYEKISVKFEDFFLDNELSQNGDCNGDHSIDIFDITTILNYLIGNGDIGEAQKTIADFNNDDDISIEDIMIILNNILNE